MDKAIATTHTLEKTSISAVAEEFAVVQGAIAKEPEGDAEGVMGDRIPWLQINGGAIAILSRNIGRGDQFL